MKPETQKKIESFCEANREPYNQWVGEATKDGYRVIYLGNNRSNGSRTNNYPVPNMDPKYPDACTICMAIGSLGYRKVDVNDWVDVPVENPGRVRKFIGATSMSTKIKRTEIAREIDGCSNCKSLDRANLYAQFVEDKD